jgi:anti-anti-sigma factor
MSDQPPGQPPRNEDIRMPIDVTTEPAVGAVVVAPHGDVDLTSSHALRAAVDRLIDGGATALVLDLSEVEFIDSTALGVLVSFHHRLGERLIIAAAQPAVLRLLEITNFISVLRLTDSVAVALSALQPQTPDRPDDGG